MTYMLYQDVFFPMFKDFKWNDWGSEEVAHFICEIRIDWENDNKIFYYLYSDTQIKHYTIVQ